MDKVKYIRETNAIAILLAWIGIIAGIISFFWASFIFGFTAIVLGLITVISKEKQLGWWAISIGILGLVIHWFIYS
jgi:hypothetical protein